MRRVMSGGRLQRAVILAGCGLGGVVLGPAASSALAQGNEILWVAQGGSDPTCASPCASLQGAVNRAGRDLQSGVASSVQIEVGPGVYRGDVAIPYLPATAPLTIQGAGPSTQLIGAGDAPVVIVQAGSRVAITDLSITGGASPVGGGVDNAGDLTLLRDTVAFNVAYDPPSGAGPFTGVVPFMGAGGGIFSTGSLTLQDSTVSHNQAAATGGGLAIRGGTLNAARDAIVENSAGPDQGTGGGITVGAGPSCCSVTDSTIAGNSATGPEATGGVFASGVSDVSDVSEGDLRLYGDTIAGNQAPGGVAGLGVYSTLVDLGGTLLAKNSPGECATYLGGIIAHGGDLSDDFTCPVELQGTDPELQSLGDYGGPSQTMAITAASPAYDANTLCDATDQRGVSRRQLGATRCDIGAYQVGAPSTYVANQAGGSVTAYAAGATGDAAPTLSLAGPNTGLSKPTGVLVDVTGKVFVANAGNNSITEYAPEVNGNVAPTATIAGNLTRLSQPQDLALDASGDLFVTNSNSSVTEYAAGATGNVAPKARIAGSATKLSSPHGIVVDSSGALRVTNNNATITTYLPGVHGNVAPARRLTINAGAARPWGLNFDPSGSLVVADSAASRVDSFAATATGSAAPLRVLSGTPPALSGPVGLDLDLAGDVFVANRASNSVSEYAPGSSGTATPLATIAGADTGLSAPFFLSELPPPPAPRVRVATAPRQSRRRIMRGGITLNVRASGPLAFHSHPITLTASARTNGHTIAAVRTMLLRPGHVRLLLIPNRRTAHFLRSSRVRALTALITIRGGAGKQVRRLTIKLTR
jgi:hypothetical protein